MTEAVPRKPRNTRLSAYYGLQNSQVARAPSVPIDREEAIHHADHLARTLPLADLLSKSAELRKSSDLLHASLHTSVRRYYEHLDATSAAACEAAEQAGALTSSVDAVRECAERCAAVTARLEASRAAVDRLEGTRRATLLQAAARQLAQQLEPAYREFADLCTDPAAARERLFLVARRTAVVLPAVETLGAQEAGFAEVAGALRDAAARVTSDLRARGASDDPYGLALVDAIRVRQLLGDSSEALREAFWEACGRPICNAGPSEAAKLAAGASGLAMASLYVSYAADQIVPEAFSVADKYADVFGMEDEDSNGDAWRDFVVWLSDVMDEAIASRVRRALRSGVFLDVDGETSVRAFLTSIERLLASSAASVISANNAQSSSELTEQDARDKPTAASTARLHVHEAVRNVCEELRAGVVESVLRETSAQWQRITDDILSGHRGKEATTDILGTVREICGRGNWFADLSTEAAWSEAALLREVGRYASKGALAREADLETISRAAMICQELSKRGSDANCSAELSLLSRRLFERVRCRVFERLEDIISTRLTAIATLGDDSPPTSSAASSSSTAPADISEIVEVIQKAEVLWQSCGVPGLRINATQSGMLGSDDAFLGEDDSLPGAVGRAWVELVRRCSIASEAGVHSMQVDAWEVGEGIVRQGAFARVVQAALERCADTEAVLLEDEQVLQMSRQRAHVRNR